MSSWPLIIHLLAWPFIIIITLNYNINHNLFLFRHDVCYIRARQKCRRAPLGPSALPLGPGSRPLSVQRRPLSFEVWISSVIFAGVTTSGTLFGGDELHGVDPSSLGIGCTVRYSLLTS